MLALHTDTTRPDRYHLWSITDRRYLMRSATEQRIREHVRVNAIEEADALMDALLFEAEPATAQLIRKGVTVELVEEVDARVDDMITNAQTIKELH